MSSLVIAELFYSCIPNMNRGSLDTGLKRIQFLVFRYRLSKNGFAGPKNLQAFENQP